MNAFSGQKTDWIPIEEIYKFTQNFTSVVYAFASCDNKPKKTDWPFMLEEVFYIGMTGGMKQNHVYDLKNRKKNKGRAETIVHKRMKDHHSKKDGKIKHDWTQNQIKLGKKIFFCFISPPENLKKEYSRNWLSMVESENILNYQQIYGNIPSLNFAERYDNHKVSIDSVSQKYISSLKTLDNFFE